MQAIVTRFAGPTNSHGGRVIARADAGSVRVGYDHGLDVEANHRAAADALVSKLGWDEYMVIVGQGSLPGRGADGYCFTLAAKREVSA